MNEELILKDPLTNFCEFYQEVQGRAMNELELEIIKKILLDAGKDVL